ncbi:retrotransposon protein, putative, ty1-copia subclass, partial [Tanacetum coccineum]
MTGAKFDIEKFDETGDFWFTPLDMEAQTKAELNKKAHSAVILCLGNKVLREVTGETTAAGVWSKFKTLYMTKSLANKLYLKKKLYTFYMPVGRKISDHIDEFNKIVLDLANIELLYGREALTLEDVMATLNSKEIKKRTKEKRSDAKDHLKRNCLKNNRKKSTDYVKKDEQPSSIEQRPSVINGSRVVLSGIRRDKCVYSLDGHAMTDELNASVEEKDSLAQVLEKQGLFGKKSLGKLNFCENYVMGKSHRVSFGVGRHTTQGVIDYIHSDLWGPSQVESLGGKKYFLSIVDDYSRRVWVYILRFKDKAFRKFKEWKQLVENQTGRTVKRVRTDNGLEFCNREFKQLCIESGIAKHLTVAGMPQLNGLAECMNRTLMDKVHCLLIQSGLPKTFWAEATCTAAYLINRSPSTAIEKNTPMEMWSGHPSDYGMLRTFGCVAYSHVKQGKLEPRAVKCVLLGYPEGVKGYRLYRLDNESPKIVTSRNVVFNESVMYKDTLKDSGAGTDKSIEELQVEVELQGLSNRTPEEDHTDQEDGDDEDAGDQETDQTQDLTDYQLVQDREPRTRTIPLRFRDESNMAAYAFAAEEEEDTHEPLTYQEAVACE